MRLSGDPVDASEYDRIIADLRDTVAQGGHADDAPGEQAGNFDHLSVITEAPDLRDVQEADGSVPLFRPIPPLIPEQVIGKPKGASLIKAPQPPKTPPPEWLMRQVAASTHGVDAGATSDHRSDHASDSSRAADKVAMPPPPPPPLKKKRTYGEAASSADVADPPPPEPVGERRPRKLATVRQTISDRCDVDTCDRMREADGCRHCAVHCEAPDCPVQWLFPQRCAMSFPVRCKHKRPHRGNSDCRYCRQHCADPECDYHSQPARESTTRT